MSAGLCALRAGTATAEFDSGVEEVRYAVGSEAAKFGGGRKLLHFVIHAESTQDQAALKFAECDPHRKTEVYENMQYFDAPLSEEGRNQCKRFTCSEHAAELVHVDLVLVSPLTRALQTATEIFPAIGSLAAPRVVVLESLREFNSSAPRPSDWRRLRSDLEPEYSGFDFSFLSPSIDMILGPGMVEHPDYCDARLMWLLAWLGRQPESNVACVTHPAVMARLFSQHFRPAGCDAELSSNMANLEVCTMPIAFE